MEKRLGGITILIEGKDHIFRINQILGEYSDIIFGRQGLPFKDRKIQVISLIVEGTTDRINALTGSLGRISGVQAKSVLTRPKSEKKGEYNDRDEEFS